MNLKKQSGFALITVFFLLTLMTSILAVYTLITRTDLSLVKASRDSASGFNAAEAGLNLRAAEIRSIFFNFEDPDGISPPNGVTDCDAGTLGSDDFACKTYSFDNSHTAVTFVEAGNMNPFPTTVPIGEPFGNLNMTENTYTARSVGRNKDGSNEAILEMTFKSRSIPMFQFAVVFEEDLEYFNGAEMIMTGPVHANSDLYITAQSGASLSFNSEITVADKLYRGRKSEPGCSGGSINYTGTVRALDPDSYIDFPSCGGGRSEITDVTAWNDQIDVGTAHVQLPVVADYTAFSSNAPYWRLADVRLALRLNSSNNLDTTNSAIGVEVVDTNGNNVEAATDAINNGSVCPGSLSGRSLGYSTSLTQHRERQHDTSGNAFQRILEIDVEDFLNCMHNSLSEILGKDLDKPGGLIIFLAVSGPDMNASHNNYGVRLSDASVLQSNISGADTIEGLTFVTDQGLNIWGNYNSSDSTWIPSALISDSMYLLSNNWDDSHSPLSLTNPFSGNIQRRGSNTTIQAAVLSGVARTGGAEGVAGQDKGPDTNGGGVINIFRFNEWWDNCSSHCGNSDFTFVGSIASLGEPIHSESSWGPFTYYSAPNRDWSFDTRFKDTANLPPGTPSFIYLKQDVFVRDYEL